MFYNVLDEKGVSSGCNYVVWRFQTCTVDKNKTKKKKKKKPQKPQINKQI